MESLKQVRYLLQQNDQMVKLDSQDRYFSVRDLPETQKYVRFQWEMNLYQVLYLCFYLQLSRRIFMKHLKISM